MIFEKIHRILSVNALKVALNSRREPPYWADISFGALGQSCKFAGLIFSRMHGHFSLANKILQAIIFMSSPEDSHKGDQPRRFAPINLSVWRKSVVALIWASKDLLHIFQSRRCFSVRRERVTHSHTPTAYMHRSLWGTFSDCIWHDATKASFSLVGRRWAQWHIHNCGGLVLWFQSGRDCNGGVDWLQ
jgi:hypothetical protein